MKFFDDQLLFEIKKKEKTFTTKLQVKACYAISLLPMVLWKI